MSVDLTHYFGIGLQIPVDFDKYDEIRKTTDNKSNIRLIEDGMNGDYTYLMYLLKETEQEEMYSNESLGFLCVDNIEMTKALDELQEVYTLFMDEELQIKNVKIISLFHCS